MSYKTRFTSTITQWYPPAPSFKEKNIGSQAGKVFIVTGGNQGVGYELIKTLYPTGATIYMASRSQDRAEKAITDITAAEDSGSERLKFLHLDLSDLKSVRSAAKKFAEQESKLDVLWNNAGVYALPVGSETSYGLEAHMGVNVVGPFLFTRLLLPHLRAAASISMKNSVRVIWTGSYQVELNAPEGGLDLPVIDSGGTKNPYVNYATSKAANWMLAVEAGERWGKDGIINVVQNPGNLKTNIHNTQGTLMLAFLDLCILYPQKMGAYTELFAGFSSDITELHQGAVIIPWGRIQPPSLNPRQDIYKALEQGKGKELWEWCEGQIERHS